MRRGGRCAAIDTPLPPDLTARFTADLARLWRGGTGEARLGVAVSGGADSLGLLLLAQAALPGRVEAATVDHGLRPESVGEAGFVAGVCDRLGVPHCTLRVTLAQGNRQEQARHARYGALAGWCAERGLAALATAHHADDQAETLLMRLNRGSGLVGLAGVRSRTSLRGVTVLRPLLGWRRTALAGLVTGAGLRGVEDPSNTDSRFDRTRIRAALGQADWLDPEALGRSAALLGEAAAFLDETIATMRCERVRGEGAALILDPPGSDFAAGELARLLIRELGGGDARRSETAALVARLRRGQNASLGGVLVRAAGAQWLFACEPQRNTSSSRPSTG
ncbi:tRNA lysidine(34) synthetase TilS [Qipengyuania sediminis]|uniref:tRNA lysidine(34) synthetase TilS n=1 Tax=Qipengyuania sediminis TaxID=1532023 RepID=UPI00105A6C97|nr:tRNA lysidine(34) synthetase TilS [Qipengyuania sediminis]